MVSDMRRRPTAARFVNRARELLWLTDGCDGRPQFRILYGRRRLGKSAVLDEFARGRRAVVYQAVEGTTQDHLRDVTAELATFTDDPVLRAGPLPNWQAVLSYVAGLAATEPFLFVIDEYQYAAEADDSLASVIQRWWSREVEARDIPLYFVICGSYIRFFEKKVLNGPMYGRNTGIWRLTPLRCADAALFFPEWSVDDQLRAHAVLGGVPYYLRQFDPGRGLAWNIANHILRKGATLYQEAELVMREELRDPGVYYSILRAIDDGCTQHGEIVNRVRPPDDRQPLGSYLGTLQALGFIESVRTIVGNSRQIWRITDPYLRFWFQYVLPNRRRLERSQDHVRAYDELVALSLDQFVSRPAFEEICREWVLDQAEQGHWGRPIGDVGAWWGKVPKQPPAGRHETEDREVDVVAVSGQRVVVAGEAKWTKAPVDFGVLNALQRTLAHIPGVDADTRIVLFGRAFEPRLQAHAAAEGIRLVGARELLGVGDAGSS
jgi:AAA+ ATPase superfamily predicted ATPase